MPEELKAKSTVSSKSDLNAESVLDVVFQLLPEAEAVYNDAMTILQSTAGQQAEKDVVAFATSVMDIIGPIFHITPPTPPATK
jgi:hypothetical protein